ncbi:MAG: pld [Gemmatimonadetes bacterium]|nr:pld [Gemmatimonadota bacterium]
MELRTLGRSGLEVSRLGLGLAAIGRPGYINLGHAQDLHGQYSVLAMEARAHRVLDAAWAAGIRYFDAARAYGRAERFLGSWLVLRDREPDAVAVGSKWGIAYAADWEVRARTHETRDHSAQALARQLVETRELLGLHLDLYHVHSATLENGVLEDAEVARALAGLKAQGVAVGLSVTGPGQADAVRRAAGMRVDGEPLFDVVQATWNLLETSAGDALREAHAAGMGVIVKEGLANGRLTERNAEAAFAPRMELLRREAARLGTTVDALALAAALAQPWADVVLSGAAMPDQVASNAAALEVPWDAEAAARLAVLEAAPEEYWETRKGLRWN